MSEWMDEVETENNELKKRRLFAKENLEKFVAYFTEIVYSQVNEINAKFFSGNHFCRLAETENSIEISFESSKCPILTIRFEPKDFIEVTRDLGEKNGGFSTLPEVIAIRQTPDGNRITFEPELFSSQRGTSQVDEEILARLLVEPVLRACYSLPQISYIDEFTN